MSNGIPLMCIWFRYLPSVDRIATKILFVFRSHFDSHVTLFSFGPCFTYDEFHTIFNWLMVPMPFYKASFFLISVKCIVQLILITTVTTSIVVLYVCVSVSVWMSAAMMMNIELNVTVSFRLWALFSNHHFQLLWTK